MRGQIGAVGKSERRLYFSLSLWEEGRGEGKNTARKLGATN